MTVATQICVSDSLNFILEQLGKIILGINNINQAKHHRDVGLGWDDVHVGTMPRGENACKDDQRTERSSVQAIHM